MMPKTSKTAKTDHDDDDEDDDDDDDDDGSDGDVRNIIASVTAHSIIYVQDRLLTAKPRKSRYNSLGFVSIASPLTNSVLTWKQQNTFCSVLNRRETVEDTVIMACQWRCHLPVIFK